jgi:hypothetical protein
MNHEWLDCRKEKPQDGDRVLCWISSAKWAMICIYHENLDWFEFESNGLTATVRWWMPLPTKPTDTSK